jgi:hypothetical protein
MIKKIVGITLLEVMLVLAIGASLLLLGVQQYKQFARQASFSEVKKNVDLLFEGLGRYYQANCRSLSDSAVMIPRGKTVTTLQGDLAPGGSINGTVVDFKTSNVVYPINIQNALITPKYLPANWPTYVPTVDANSYAASFVFMLTTKSAYACWNLKQTQGGLVCNTDPFFPGDPDVGPQEIQPNQVAFWLVQVSVRVQDDADGSKTLAFLGPTGANCASSVPDHCDGSETPQYLIWQQLPTRSGARIGSDLWPSQVQEVLFNQQYTHDVMYEMTTPNYAPADSGIDTNYLCGN